MLWHSRARSGGAGQHPPRWALVEPPLLSRTCSCLPRSSPSCHEDTHSVQGAFRILWRLMRRSTNCPSLGRFLPSYNLCPPADTLGSESRCLLSRWQPEEGGHRYLAVCNIPGHFYLQGPLTSLLGGCASFLHRLHLQSGSWSQHPAEKGTGSGNITLPSRASPQP